MEVDGICECNRLHGVVKVKLRETRERDVTFNSPQKDIVKEDRVRQTHIIGTAPATENYDISYMFSNRFNVLKKVVYSVW